MKRHPGTAWSSGWLLGFYFGALASGGDPSPLALVAGVWLAWVATERW